MNSQFQFKLLYWHDRYFYICIADKNQCNDKSYMLTYSWPDTYSVLISSSETTETQFQSMCLNKLLLLIIFFQHLLWWCVMLVKDMNSVEWMWISDSVQDSFIPLDLPATLKLNSKTQQSYFQPAEPAECLQTCDYSSPCSILPFTESLCAHWLC